MTEQKQAFDKRELKALFRELLKPYAMTIPEIGNQDNAFNDAIPYLHRIFSGNDNYDWKLQDLFYNFEDQIDGATDKGAEARRVFVLLLKVYILLEYMNNPYRLSLDNPFGHLCGKINDFAAKVKQTCIENEVDMDFMEFMEKVYEEEDPTDWGFSQLIGQKIVNLPYWDNNRYHLLTVPYKPEVGQSSEVSPNSKSAGKVQINSNTERAELLNKINELQNEINSLKKENKNLESKLDDYFVDNECDDTNIFHIDYKARTELIYKLLKNAGVDVENSQAVAHLCVLLIGYKSPRTIYNFVRDLNNGSTKSNKSYWHDIDRLNAALTEGLSSKSLIIQKRDKDVIVDSIPDKSIYQDDVEKMKFRTR